MLGVSNVAVDVRLRAPRRGLRYWRSLFTYAWVGDGSALGIPAGVDSFTGFVRWADAQASARSDGAFEHSLSFTLYLACGHPCRHDYLLRTETLETDVRLAASTARSCERVRARVSACA